MAVNNKDKTRKAPASETAKAPAGAAPETAPVIGETDNASEKPMGRNNFIMMAISAVLIIFGFILIAGSPSTVESYNADIFSTRRIVVGPMFCFLGFVLMAVAIIMKPSAKLQLRNPFKKK